MYRTILVAGVMLLTISTTFAGVNIDSPYDHTVAIYHFENRKDSGPRGLDFKFVGNAKVARETGVITAQVIAGGKVGKALRLRGLGCLCTVDPDRHLAIVGGEFSIVAWVKIPKQENQFFISMEAWGNDDTEHRVGEIALVVNNDGNLIGSMSKGIARAGIGTNAWDNTERDVADNKWHHIAFTQYGDYLNLFVDGQLAKREKLDQYMGFIGNETLIRIGVHNTIKSQILVDDLGFFETGFSPYEIKALRNSQSGLKGFLEVMPVDPADKVATTWGAMKSQVTRQ